MESTQLLEPTYLPFAKFEMFSSTISLHIHSAHSFFLFYFLDSKYMKVGSFITIPQVTESHFPPIFLFFFRSVVLLTYLQVQILFTDRMSWLIVLFSYIIAFFFKLRQKCTYHTGSFANLKELFDISMLSLFFVSKEFANTC